MNKDMKRKTREAAVENVKRLFTETVADVISVEEAYKAWGRSPENIEANRIWLSNKLIDLKYYDLIQPLYVFKNSRRILEKIKLTESGKKIVERPAIYQENNSKEETEIKEMKTDMNDSSIHDLMDLVTTIRDKYPKYHITFEIKLKEAI